MPMVDRSDIAGVILAGGLARRMGEMGRNDKALLELGGKPILQHVIDRLRPQVGRMVINANGDPSRFSAFGLPVAADPVDGFAGPLAGVLAGLNWAAETVPGSNWVATIACDTPFFPPDLVEQMSDGVAAAGADMACAASGGRNHPVFGLWPVALRDALRTALVDEDIRKVDRWTARYRLAVVEFPAKPFDPFFNANRPEDLEKAERLMRELAA